MTIQDLLQSDDFANIKQAAIMTTPEQFHEAALDTMNLINFGIDHPIQYSSIRGVLFLCLSFDRNYLSANCLLDDYPVCAFSLTIQAQANLGDYLQDLDKQLRKFTSTIQKNLSQML